MAQQDPQDISPSARGSQLGVRKLPQSVNLGKQAQLLEEESRKNDEDMERSAEADAIDESLDQARQAQAANQLRIKRQQALKKLAEKKKKEKKKKKKGKGSISAHLKKSFKRSLMAAARVIGTFLLVNLPYVIIVVICLLSLMYLAVRYPKTFKTIMFVGKGVDTALTGLLKLF